MDDLISVIIPVYNVEKYLGDCVMSVIHQVYNNLEILLIDDGSTDRSGLICDELCEYDRRIIAFHKENGGLSDARNFGISVSHGNYIIFIDSDDIVSENFIYEMYMAQQDTKCMLVCCEMVCFYEDDTNKLRKYWGKKYCQKKQYVVYSVPEILKLSFYQKISITGAPQKLYSKELFEDIIFPKGRYYEDMATTYKFLIKAQNVCVLDQKLYAYRIRTDGIMNCTFNKRKLDCIWVAENLYNDICKYDYSLLRSAACAAFRINRLVYPQIPNDQIIYREAVWNEIEKYRKLVYADKEAKLYERILALTSCLGDNFLEWAVVVFNKIRKLYYKIKLKT